MSVGLGQAVTVDQPPLAVGVRFPLCPPVFSSDDGPIGPSPFSMSRRKGRLTARKAIDHQSVAFWRGIHPHAGYRARRQ
jgi:hypothetical protein